MMNRSLYRRAGVSMILILAPCAALAAPPAPNRAPSTTASGAEARSPHKAHGSPPATQPSAPAGPKFAVRPARPPITSADRTACARELADVLQFAHVGKDSRCVANAIGSDEALEPANLLDRLVRLDRLAEAKDCPVAATAGQARALVIQSWRLNQAMVDFGDTTAYWYELQTNISAEAFSRFMGHMAAREAYENSGRLRQFNFGGKPVNFREHPGGAPPNFSISGALEEARRRVWNASDGEKHVADGLLLETLRDPLRERMSALWERDLWPALRSAAGPPVKSLPLVFGPPSVVSGTSPWRRCPYGWVGCRLDGTRSLHHVGIRIDLKNESGDRVVWWGYLNEFQPGDGFAALSSGQFGEHWGEFSKTISGTYCVCCDEGLLEGVAVDPGPPPSAEDRLRHKSSRRMFERESLVNREDLLAERRRDEPLLNDVLRAGEQCYPVPPNPEKVRAAIGGLIAPGTEYVGAVPLLDRGVKTVRVRFADPFDAQSPCVAAEIVEEWPAGYTTSGLKNGVGSGRSTRTAMVGRFIDETNRGSVMELSRERSNVERVTRRFVAGELQFLTRPADIRGALGVVTEGKIVPPYVVHLGEDGRLALQYTCEQPASVPLIDPRTNQAPRVGPAAVAGPAAVPDASGGDKFAAARDALLKELRDIPGRQRPFMANHANVKDNHGRSLQECFDRATRCCEGLLANRDGAPFDLVMARGLDAALSDADAYLAFLEQTGNGRPDAIKRMRTGVAEARKRFKDSFPLSKP